MFRRQRDVKRLFNPTWFHTLKSCFQSQFNSVNFEFTLKPNEDKIILHTDTLSPTETIDFDYLCSNIIPSDISTITLNHSLDISWNKIDKYAKCLTKQEVYAINSNYKNDLTKDKEWVYNLTSFNGSGRNLFTGATFTRSVFNAPVITSMYDCMNECKKMTEVILNTPKLTDGRYMCNNCINLKTVSGDLSKLQNGYEAFKNTPVENFYCEVPCLSNGYRFLTIGGNTTDVGARLNKESALRILNSVPSYTSGTHQLQIGIHIRHKEDETVLNAIANAEVKGWTMTVHWNGTLDDNTTYGLRRDEIIYAKKGEHITSDGITENVLEWGHYVTNWEEQGYRAFSSVKEANDYFDLTNS